MSGEERDERRGRSSYLDLLISTLMEHEKKMDSLVERLQKVAKDLSTIHEEDNSNTLIYMKIKTDHSIDEIVKIIESLKK